MAHGNDYNDKKYYWLKLDRHFFNNARIKKLRRLAGGDAFTIIYLKLMLLSIELGGVLIYEGIENSFEKEMALKIEEELENVIITINYLKIQGLLIEKDEDFILPQAQGSIGKETQSNIYKRNKKLELFQPPSNLIPIEIEKDKEKDKEIEIDKEDVCGQAAEPTPEIAIKRFCKPSVNQIKDYCLERNNKVDAQRFYDFYESKGWKVGKTPMKDWKACVRTWEIEDKTKKAEQKSNNVFYDIAKKKGLAE